VDPVSKQISCTVSGNDSIVFTYNTDGSIANYIRYSKQNNIYTPDIECAFQYTNSRFNKEYHYYYNGNVKNLQQIDSIIYNSKNLPVQKIIVSGTYQPIDTLTFTYNDNNLPAKIAWNSFTYNEFSYSANGNVTTIIKVDAAKSTFTYQYDNKINPYKGNNLQFGSPEYFYAANNITKRTNGTDSKMFAYEYDADGYPTKVTTTWSGSSSVNVLRIYYK
jgi:YD repeat-containing protein